MGFRGQPEVREFGKDAVEGCLGASLEVSVRDE